MPPRKPHTGRLASSTNDLKTQLAAILRENRQLGEQHVTVEQQLSNLATLYVAVNSLHLALDATAVVAAIQEIVANLIGSEEMAIFEVDAARGRLTLLTSIGIDSARYENLRIGDGPIGTVALTGASIVRHESGSTHEAAGPVPTACIPLRLDGRVAGVIAIFGLLPQKSGLDDVDFGLFEVLATHAAAALTFTRLYTETGGTSGAHA